MTSEPAVALEDVRVGGRRIVITPHSCFACGTLNVHGLHLELHAGGDVCWTELALPERFAGWEGIAHGGIVCTILDEVMAWALIDHDLWGVTAKMAVAFRRPVPVGRSIRAEGRVVDVRRRVVTAAGLLVDAADGTVLATADGLYVGAPEARKDDLKRRYGYRLEPERPGPPDTVDRVRGRGDGRTDTTTAAGSDA